MKKVISLVLSISMLCSLVAMPARAAASNIFGNEYKLYNDFEKQKKLEQTEIGESGYKVSTDRDAYNIVAVRDKSSKNEGYYPYGSGLADNGYYLFIGYGASGTLTSTLTFPEKVNAGKYIKITYAKPSSSNGSQRSGDGKANNTDTVTVGSEEIDLQNDCDFDVWYTTTVKANADITALTMKLGQWSAIAISNIEVLDSADTMELTADTTEMYITSENRTLQYTATVYNSITTVMGDDEVTARGTEDNSAGVSYSVNGYNGVSIDANGLLTITPQAQEGEVTVSAEYGSARKELKLELKTVSDADGVKIAGDEMVAKNGTLNLKAIPTAQGTVIPERATDWTIEGDNLGSTIENGVLTAGNTAGNITVKATLKVEGTQTTADVSDTFTVTIRDEAAVSPYTIKGVFLKNCAADLSTATGVDGLAIDTKTVSADYKAVVKALDENGILIKETSVSLDSAAAGVTEIKTPLTFINAAQIKAYIINGKNEIVSEEIYKTTKTLYKNVPLVSDWITGAKSELGMESANVVNPVGVPYGINADTVDTSTENVKYSYDDATYPNPTSDNALWYKKGAYHAGQNSIYARDGVDWEQNALPIGNGYMGGMLFGLPDKDQIQINEETFWAAGYRGVQSPTNNTLSVNRNMSEGINGFMSVGNIFVDFDMQKDAQIKNYYRDLNLDDAVAHVKYEYNGVKYEREYFASYPKEVLAFRYTADTDGALSFDVNPVSMHPGEVTVKDGEITIAGNLKDSEPYGAGGNAVWSDKSDLEYCTKIKVVAEGGTVTDGYNTVNVKNADAVTILVAAATDYDKDQFTLKADSTVDMEKTPYKSLTDGIEITRVENRINSAAAMTYDALKAEHIADYKSQFDKVKFSLTDDSEICKTPTDELQGEYKKIVNVKTDSEDDPKQTNNDEKKHSVVSYDKAEYAKLNKHLEELHFNYARYMMISSSRSNTMPATLQGKWCQSVAEIWGSCYCININLEMNYWFAGGANLEDSTKSLVYWLKSQIPAGTVTAKNYYGVTPKSYTLDGHTITFTESADDKDDVFIMHTKQAIMGTTDLTGSTNIQSAGNTAWLMYNLWDLYQTTGDKELLENEIYPIMRKLANFYTQYLYNLKKETDDLEAYPAGYYYTTWKGRSPEHGPENTEGIKYDLQLVAGMYDYTIAAATTLGVDADKIASWQEIRNHLETPIEIGEDGQIKEWKQEAKYGFDASGNQLGTLYHRHISHLVGLYPGTLINRTTPELIDGAKVVLQKRGDGSTGWSTSNKFLLWARALDGDKALEIFRYQLAQKTYSNLFDYHAPFQIDGNFGSAAGVMELLMQSQPLNQEQMNTQTAPIYILPALPTAWDKGEISGIKAKNGAEVSIKWNENKATEIQIRPAKDGDITIGYDKGNIKSVNGQAIEFTDGKYTIKNAEKGVTYTFSTDAGTETERKITELTVDHVTATGADGDTLIVAGYTGGILDKCEIINGLSSDLTGYENCETVKAFLWNSISGMKPYDCKEVTVTQ